MLFRPCQGDLFFAQTGMKQNTCVRIINVIYLQNDEKIYTKQGGGAFINMLHSNKTCRTKCNHDPILNIHMANKCLHKPQDRGPKD